MAIIKCPNCKNTMSSNDKSCPTCGSKYEPEFCCPQCGNKDLTFAASSPANKELTYVCKQCGCKFTRRNQTSNEGASSQIQTQICEAPKPQKYNLITAYISLLKKAFQFRGRSRRREYWLSFLACFLLNQLCIVLSFVLLTVTQSGALYYVALYYVAMLAMVLHVIPLLSMTVRRLHDSGHSGGWLFVPFIGSIVVFVMLLQDSDYGDNQYGPNPKGLS